VGGFKKVYFLKPEATHVLEFSSKVNIDFVARAVPHHPHDKRYQLERYRFMRNPNRLPVPLMLLNNV